MINIFFLWSMLASIHPCKNNHPTRVSNYRQLFGEMNIQGFDFSGGFKCSDVHKLPVYLFSINNLSINTLELSFYQDQNDWKHKLIPIEFSGLFRFFPPPPPSPTDKIIISPPHLADMLSWVVWFRFLPNKVIANTCLFISTSFSKQSASWKVLEICELCALSTDSRKTCSVNKYMNTGGSSYSFDGGGDNPLGGGEETEKTRI